MILLRCVLFASLLVWMTEAQLNFDYLKQDEWGDLCNLPTSREQTPTNIVTANVEVNKNIIPLEFDDQWEAAVNGTYRNGGINLGFFPSTFGGNGARPTLRNYLGTYEHLQFHMHWGMQNNMGTGHQIDGVQYGLEFHWVNPKLNSNFSFATATNQSDRNSLSLVAVLAEANDSMPISGIWAKLDPTMVINNGDAVNVTNVLYSNLLPKSRDFYYTPGSYTSPQCFEIVHWFVMKERIQVPSAYLTKLRTMRFDSGELMLTNHRDAQPIYDRTVYTAAGAVKQAASLVVLISSALIVFGYNIIW